MRMTRSRWPLPWGSGFPPGSCAETTATTSRRMRTTAWGGDVLEVEVYDDPTCPGSRPSSTG
jgi:hypothetical protein